MNDDMDVENTQPDVDQEESIENPSVLQKYKSACDSVNETIKHVIQQCQPGKSVLDVCVEGDKFIEKSLKSKLKKLKKISRGVAFPTCVSVNDVVCHYSPIQDDNEETIVLKANDVVKVDVGGQIDGYIAVGATTFILGNNSLNETQSKTLVAAKQAMDVALRMMKPGNKNTDVSLAVNKVASVFGVNTCEGVLSHQLKRFVIDGHKTILLKPTIDQTVDEFEFEKNEVYALDIVLSTGEGKLKEAEQRTTIYKRRAESSVMLKRKASKQVLNDIKKFENLPFVVRSLDPKTGRIGILELYRNNMVDPYPVLKERSGEFVVHLKTTVLITPSAVIQGTEIPLQDASSNVSAESDSELKSILQRSLKINKKKKKSKKKADEMDTNDD